MGVNLVQADDGSMGIQGKDLDVGAFIMAECEYGAAAVDKVFFVAPRAMKATNAILRVTVAGTDAGAVSAVLRKVPSGTAITAGTAINSGSVNLKGTADTNQLFTMSVVAGAVNLAAGDALAVDFTGVLTSAIGTFCVGLTTQ